jgi:hypothetical protein
MKTLAIVSFAAAVMLAALSATPAGAIPRTFVAGNGSGSTCTRAAPCATFQEAHDATDSNGEINCIDTGAFGGLIISKSITIDCAGSAAAAGSQIGIDTPGVTVRLRNLTLTTQAGFTVSFTRGAALFIERCTLTGGTGGIQFDPSDGAASRLFVSDSIIDSASANGIQIVAVGSTAARATIDGVRIDKSSINGLIAVGGIGGSGAAIVQIRNSVVVGNPTAGVVALANAGSGIASVTVDRSSMTLNGNGVQAQGPSAFVLVGRSTVMSNSQGLAVGGGGHILSYQNNHLTGNVSDGTPTSMLSVH